MALLNYTTTIAAEKTVGEVMGLLSRAGATAITTGYDGHGNPTSLSFVLATAHGPQSFRLPVNTDVIWRVLVRQNQAGKVPPRYVSREQAARTGWRIIKDWVAAQLALIETEMVSPVEVFLPYLLNAAGVTVYEHLERTRFQLGPGTAKQGT